jgi:SAM-dependent methyltransferase
VLDIGLPLRQGSVMLSPKFWDDRYDAPDYVYGTEPSDFLAERWSALRPGGDVLCLADGEGRNGVFLATKGMRVTGVDSSSVGLAKARQLASERGVPLETVVADLGSWDLGAERWDGIVSIWAHLPAPIRSTLHPRLGSALRPRGVLLLEHYHPRQLGYGTGGPPDPSMMLTLDELDVAFAGWIRLHTFEGERVVVEGRGHGGTSYVTQAILQKPG